MCPNLRLYSLPSYIFTRDCSNHSNTAFQNRAVKSKEVPLRGSCILKKNYIYKKALEAKKPNAQEVFKSDSLTAWCSKLLQTPTILHHTDHCPWTLLKTGCRKRCKALVLTINRQKKKKKKENYNSEVSISLWQISLNHQTKSSSALC